MTEVALAGCRPEPLASYLKALGVFRLMAEQADGNCRGLWRGDVFTLETGLARDEILDFFLSRYQPTPVLAPWNGGSGFHPKDNKAAVEALREAAAARLAGVRAAIRAVDQVLDDLGLEEKPDKSQKPALIRALRNRLPDEAERWLDTAVLLTAEVDDTLAYPPLTGTGGNDGRLDFTRNFMARVLDLVDPGSGEPTSAARPLLDAALLGEVRPGLLKGEPIGQFSPAAAGGANAVPGFAADSQVNPWDYVLMIEGTMLFTAAATRRLAQKGPGELAYPFSVRASGVGYGSAAQDDEATSRAELWAPLWSAPATLEELRMLFGEGRAKVGRRTARTGVDFARAVASLGVHRGLSGFVRYGFHVRNGLAYFATPLGRFHPKQNPVADLLGPIDGWLSTLRRAATDAQAPASLARAHRGLEEAIMGLAQGETSTEPLLVALGAVDAAVARSRRNLEGRLRPVEPLDPIWAERLDETAVEVRLAWALASRGLRRRLIPVDRFGHWSMDVRGAVWTDGSLEENLLRVLSREETEAARAKPEAKDTTSRQRFRGVRLADVAAFIEGEVDDTRIEALARGLALVKGLGRLGPGAGTAWVPPAYGLLALASLDQLPGAGEPLPRTPGMLTRAAAGEAAGATRLAARRLLGAGYLPVVSVAHEPPARMRRIAAALAFPIAPVDQWVLLRSLVPSYTADHSEENVDGPVEAR